VTPRANLRTCDGLLRYAEDCTGCNAPEVSEQNSRAVRAGPSNIRFWNMDPAIHSFAMRSDVSAVLINLLTFISYGYVFLYDRLCGLVVSVANYKHRGPGFDSRALLRIFMRGLGLERGPLSLVIG
jgi:hypothetical protein